MKLKSCFVITLIFIFSISAPAFAVKKPTPKPVTKVAPKALKVLLAKPDVITNLSGAPGDQIAGALISATSLFIIGTVESSTVGGSDGYVASYDFTGKKSWELHLGGVADEIAASGVVDKAGNLWVAGSQNSPATSNLPNVDTQSINVDTVSVTPIFTPSGSLSQLAIWKISPTGQLLATYSIESGALIVPIVITASVTGFQINGTLNDQYFTSTIDLNGTFGKITKTLIKPIAAPVTASLKVGTGTLKSYISKGPIAGIPTWNPKVPTPVLIQRSKAGIVIRANYFQGRVMELFYKSGIGPVVITDLTDGYGITFLGLA